MRDDKAQCRSCSYTQRVMSFQESPHLHMGNFLMLSTPLSRTKPQLSTHINGQREGVHIKAEMSKEQDSSDTDVCSADSTPVHKGIAWE